MTMDKLKTWIKQALTEDDNATICVAKVLAVISFFTFIGYAVYGLIHGDHHALNEFGNGLMTVLLGSGGLIAGKQLSQK
jgi:hypothetical protein